MGLEEASAVSVNSAAHQQMNSELLKKTPEENSVLRPHEGEQEKSQELPDSNFRSSLLRDGQKVPRVSKKGFS